ncbi:MAG: bacterial Ig-like domain-containing protein, partial [Treponema sp.]|nr:bacterial Ig-like domain-containing protein [Treponema sp.]
MKNLHSFSDCKKVKTAVLIISTFFLSGFAALFSSCTVESDSSYPTMLMSISADYYDMKTNYAVGEKLDLTGLKVYATFSDGSFKEIKDYQTSYSKGYTFTDRDAEQCSYSGMGYLELGISYQGFHICVFLYVSAAGTSNVESIQISEPSKKNYLYGDKLDLSGLTVTALYQDGSTKTVSGWTSFPADGSELKKTGTQEIQIYYGGVSASFSIEVSALDGSKSTSFFWGKWIRMDTGTVYEVLDTAVKVNGNYKPIISCSDSSINISEVGTLEKESDRIIKNEDNIPFFRYGGTNLEYSLKVVGFTDSESRAISSSGLKGLKGKGKSDTYTSFETKESYTDENGLIKLTAPTVGDSQTVTIEKDDGGLVVVPNIVIENTGDFMGTVAIVE